MGANMLDRNAYDLTLMFPIRSSDYRHENESSFNYNSSFVIGQDRLSERHGRKQNVLWITPENYSPMSPIYTDDPFGPGTWIEMATRLAPIFSRQQRDANAIALARERGKEEQCFFQIRLFDPAAGEL